MTDKGPTPKGISTYFTRTVLVVGILTCVYVLSFGPVTRLSTRSVLIDGSTQTSTVIRSARFPSWQGWTPVVYRPLYAVWDGKAGMLPYRILDWYMKFWL